MITIDMVKEVWSNYEKFTETAEQHDFPLLLTVQIKFQPLYKDLLENWDEDHALIFMKWMQEIAKHFGFKCPEFTKGE